MNMMNRFLVGTEAAASFMTLAATETGAKAFLGDHERYSDTQASTEILNANIALKNGAATIEALAKDETRTVPQRHDAAAKLADRVIAQLTKTKGTVGSTANALYESGVNEADAHFAPKLERGSLDSEIRSWIREQSKLPEGIGKVTALIKEDAAAAGVVFHSPNYLLGIQKELHSKMRFDAVEQHLPAAYKRMTDSLALQELLPKYDRAISSVRTSFYSQAERARMGSRVAVD